MGEIKKEYLYLYEGTNVFQFHLKSQWGQNGREGILKVSDNFSIHFSDYFAEKCLVTHEVFDIILLTPIRLLVQ